MRKLLPLIFLIALWPMLTGVVVIQTTTAGCDAGSEYVGTQSVPGTYFNWDIGSGTGECFLYTPSCADDLNTGYLYKYDVDTDNAKLCVYSDDGDSQADASDLLLGCATETGSSIGWKNASFDGGTLSDTSTVWLCVFPDTTGWKTRYPQSGSSATRYNDSSCSGCYSSPPANLTGFASQTSRDIPLYGTIGN